MNFKQILNSNIRIFIIVLIAAFAIYANAISGKFVFDDNLFIENNEQIKSLSNIPELYFSSVTEGSHVAKDNFYRPNQQALFALIYAAFGLNPIPFHIASVLFHAFNSFLIFLLFMKLGAARKVSFFSSIVFLIHPINTQAVSYISGMADPLGMMFVLCALFCFVKTVSSEMSKQFFLNSCFSILFFIFGIFTKENTIIFPALVFITLIFLFKKIPYEKKKIIYSLSGIYFLIAGIYLYFKFTTLNFSGNIGLTDQKNIYTENLYIRIVTFLNILPEYFKMIFFPIDLNYEKPYVAYTDFQRADGIFALLVALLFITVTFYKAIKIYKKAKVSSAISGAVTGGLWFFICLAPVSGIIPVNAIYLEHWLYYPLAGVIFSAAKIYEHQKIFVKNIFLIILIPLSVAYCIRTVLRNSEWANPEKFYKNELKYSPNSARMHNNLAMIYADEKKCPVAISHYKKAIALYDIYPQTHHNLARCYEALGNYNEAINEYFNALLIYPNFTYSHKYLYNVFSGENDTLHAKIFENFLMRIQNEEIISKQEIIETMNSFKK